MCKDERASYKLKPMHKQIAIDGPVASGKTAVGKLLSEKLGWRFLDTGLMYRAITWLALDEKIDVSNHEKLVTIAMNSQIQLIPSDRGDRFIINENDITDSLRNRDVERSVSLISQISGVRAVLCDIYGDRDTKEIANSDSIVMVGRDIGIRVLKYADVKVFLTASPDVRAKRRMAQTFEANPKATLQMVKSDLERRDLIDSQNEESPLLPADDSVIINTDKMELDEVVEAIMKLVVTE